DEVRNFGEIDKGKSAKIKDGELELAVRLMEDLSNGDFKPEQYQDEYRQRVMDLVNQKVEGKEITAVGPQVQHGAQVIDLMEALKESLAKRIPQEKKGAIKVRRAEATSQKPEKKAKAAKK